LSASGPTEPQPPRDGILAINKERGWTSHDVVARVRRLVGQKRVGHAGTLDPAATGVLPICIGQATRVVEYLGESGKSYRATITFGVATTTYDAEGDIIAQHDLPATLDRVAIESVLPDFTGAIQQVPPMYSALKRNGKRLYELARAGEQIELAPRPVRIDALRIVAWDAPTLVLDVDCGKGTYIRSLAHDLGERFGCGAHLAALERTRVGPFTLARCITLDALALALNQATWGDHLYAPDEALLHLHAAILGAANEQRARQGQPLLLNTASALAPATQLRAYSTDGRFLGILTGADDASWRPTKIFQVTPVE
jgi:tRNA pseudouridine55 synthase